MINKIKHQRNTNTYAVVLRLGSLSEKQKNMK